MALFNWLTALNLTSYQVISLIGSGGKTSLLNRLALTMAAQGEKAVFSTTTKIFPPAGNLPIEIALEDKLALEAVLKGPKLKYVLGPLINDKYHAPPLSLLQQVANSQRFNYMILEADGSKQRPLKFPAPYEPVLIDYAAQTIVLIIGSLALNKLATSTRFHRLNLAEKYLKFQNPPLITKEIIAQIVSLDEGYGRVIKKYPTQIVFNQVDNAKIRDDVLAAAYLLKENPLIENVYLTSLQQNKLIAKI